MKVLVSTVFLVSICAVSAVSRADTPSWLWPKDDVALTADGADAPTMPSHTNGPILADLGSAVRLDLPAGYVMFSAETARDMLAKVGENTEGVVAIAIKQGSPWSMTFVYDGVGYVADDEADSLDASELLTQMRAGTIEQNKLRIAKGTPELFVDDWTTKPHYDAKTHRLQWGISAHDREGKILNELTRVLGRNGIVSINLIATPDEMTTARAESTPLVAGVSFLPGATYADHKDGDRDSGLGLSGLVLGGAGIGLAAKTGVIASILLALKKGIIAIVAAVGGFFKWITGKKKKAAAAAAAEPPAT